MHRFAEGSSATPDAAIAERVEALAAWVDEIAERLRAAELATGDEKTAKELRRAIEAVTKHDPKLESRLIERVEVLADRFATLASTVSTTSAALARKDGEIAGLRRELDESSGRVKGLLTELGRRASTEDVEKLRAMIATLSSQRPESGKDRSDRIAGKVEWLSERVDTLATTVATTAAGLAARDGELVTLRQKLEQGSSEAAQAVAELQAPLAGRLDSLAHGLTATTGKLAGQERDVAALRARIDDAYAKASAVISELQRSVSAVSSRVGAVEELPVRLEHALTAHAGSLDSRLETLSDALSATIAQLADLAAASSDLEAGSASVQAKIDGLSAAVAQIEQSTAGDEAERRLAELAERLALLASEVAANTDAIAGRDGDVAELRARIDDASATAGTSSSALQQSVAAISQRVDAVEQLPERLDRALAVRGGELDARLEALSGSMSATMSRLADLETGSSEGIDRVARAVDYAKASVQAQLDDLAATVTLVEQSAANGESDRLDELAGRVDQLADALEATTAAAAGRAGDVAALRSRIDEAYAKASGVISELQLSLGALLSRVGALERLPEQLEPRAELLDELGARLALVERGRESVEDQIGKVLDTWASDRSSLEARFQDVERQLSRTEELDDLARRLDAVEHGAHGVFAPTDGPAAGDGRFRLELRALELRLEQAEATAREGRDAVFVQLERIASRIERRLRSLEANEEDPPHGDATPTGAEVVPFRGAEV